MAAVRQQQIQLDDRYTGDTGPVLLTGLQALVRLPLMQARRDHAVGLNTGGFISGYRGSPVGTYDKQLWAAAPLLEANRIHFQPGLNEDLAATAVWGSQQVGLQRGARHQGVFGLWYGKGPGVDRSGDALKHANHAGSSRYGGVLAVAGDDHACKSSSLPHQSEYAFMAAGIPILDPVDIADLLSLGLHGWAMSRYSGCWVGIKALAELMDSSATVDLDACAPRIALPQDFTLPEGGLNIRWPDPPPAQEARLLNNKLAAAQAYVRANGLDRVTHGGRGGRLDIVTTGKSWLDLMQAFEILDLDMARLRRLGVRVYRVAMSWPLEPRGALAFCNGSREVLVIEEKRPLIEDQLRQLLYGLPDARRPRIVGKQDLHGQPLLPATMDLNPVLIARALGQYLDPFAADAGISESLTRLAQLEAAASAGSGGGDRVPHYCAGCPHNRSTRVPSGSRAMAGIGCHYMAMWIQPDTRTFTHMGAEGATWIGQAPFTDEPHVFQNMGDGTYYHSGSLAIRAAVAAGVNMTYKLLWNDAVAMTGGQPVEGHPDVQRVLAQLLAEGVKRIAVVSDNPARIARRQLPAGVTVHDRRELDLVQRSLREADGVTVLLYLQPCANETRRRRKRGALPPAPRRVVINQAVCEGCGDCERQSGCLAIIARDTAFGRKRQVDQTACNSDYSCLDGFCPSFVTVRGASKRPPVKPEPDSLGALPEPRRLALDRPWRILVPGVGGTGVVTVSALLGTAAHLDGLQALTLDQAGLAQKYGAVTSHVQFAPEAGMLHAARICAGEADLLLATDLVVATSRDVLMAISAGRTAAVANHQTRFSGAFAKGDGNAIAAPLLEERLRRSTRRLEMLDAARLTQTLLGDTTASNMLLLGYAWQQGLLPVSRQAIEQAIHINGTAVTMNRAAFRWGRQMAHRPQAVLALMEPGESGSENEGLEQQMRRHADHLSIYQDQRLAERYLRMVERARAMEQAVKPGSSDFAMAVAESYGRLLAYKDEYEVARLLSDPAFITSLQRDHPGGRLEFHLAPPLLSRADRATGRARKRRFGAWLLPALRILARCRRLRGTWADPFSHSADRRLERDWIRTYEHWLETLFQETRADTLDVAIEIAALPQDIRGYGPIKTAAAARAEERARELWLRFETGDVPPASVHRLVRRYSPDTGATAGGGRASTPRR